EEKLVTVEFTLTPATEPTQLQIRVVDQGEGFDPVEVADPLAPENLLKSSGRGIFFMRNFMDDLRLQRGPDGGMEVVMVKRVTSADS
ncbi:MAG: ATP-binding protein, partial [bacterium]